MSYLEKYEQVCNIVCEKAKDFGLTREEVEHSVAILLSPTTKEISNMTRKLLSQLDSRKKY